MARKRIELQLSYEVEEENLNEAIEELEDFAVDILNMPQMKECIDDTIIYKIEVKENKT